MRRFLIGLILTTLFPLTAMAEGRSIIVLDASGSMWGQIDGRAKLELAREALAEVVAKLPEGSEVGLMAYGHREKGSCADIELIVPPAAGTGQQIIDAANKLNFLGKTPLSEAVRQAAEDLRSSEEKATVILITDGIETCEADPCALGTELEKSGVDFTAHVVGFGLSDEEGKQVACLAENTGGQYIQAGDLDSLTLALENTIILAEPGPAPEPEPAPAPQPAALEINLAPTVVLAPGVAKPEDNIDVVWELHSLNADGTTGERLDTNYNVYKAFVEPGKYRLVVQLGQALQEVDVTLTADTLAAPEIIMNAARVLLHPKGAAGQEDSTDAALTFVMAGGIDSTEYGTRAIYLPAGEVTVTATLDQATVTETISLAPGDLVERDIIISSGVAVINGFYAEGMLMENTQHSVEILEAKKALDGTRKGVTTGYGPDQSFSLPPGDYIARVTQDAAIAETPFSVKVGERVEVPVILNAGIGFISAPGAASIEVFFAKKDINGYRDQAGFGYVDEITLTLPAGDYVAVATRDDTTLEGPFSVKTGERSEVTLNLP